MQSAGIRSIEFDDGFVVESLAEGRNSRHSSVGRNSSTGGSTFEALEASVGRDRDRSFASSTHPSMKGLTFADIEGESPMPTLEEYMDAHFMPPLSTALIALHRRGLLLPLLYIAVLVVSFIASAIISYVFILPVCDLFFRCGCTWQWDGGIAECNIFDDNDPDCPWCSAPPSASWIPAYGSVVAMTTSSLVVFSLFLLLVRRRWQKNPDQNTLWWLWVAVLVGALSATVVVTFLVFTTIAAVAFWLASDYPYFLWIDQS